MNVEYNRENYLHSGTLEYRRTNIALIAAAFATFALLYCAQPLMPVFSADFHIDPSVASLSLSVASATLAAGLLVVGRISDTVGRKVVIACSLFIVGSLTCAAAFATSWTMLLVMRALAGFAMSGVPAIGMAYLSEEVHPRDLGGAVGLYIAGNAFGGMTGRVITGGLIQATNSWRIALGTIGLFGLIAAMVFLWALPPSRRFVSQPGFSLRSLLSAYALHLRDPGLRLLFLFSFLLMGSFVSIYNYVSYRLLEPPYSLGQAVAGMIFLSYLFGGPASAWFGRIGGRYGRGRVMLCALGVFAVGLALTLPNFLPATIAGIAVVTVGFFGAYSIASSWVGRRALTARGQAASFYFFCYYMGASVIGSFAGLFWSYARWPGVAGLVACLIAAAMLVAYRLSQLDESHLVG